MADERDTIGLYRLRQVEKCFAPVRTRRGVQLMVHKAEVKDCHPGELINADLTFQNTND